ncbi:MAG TPA: DUF5655 domain-containing protein [Acidobacteriota bacterium]|nr:DUF5655 domain-containing protein [Acidobacteriota bacterium]
MKRTVRFRAVIRIAGINPYAEIPGRVSEAFAEFAENGRIHVDGALNGKSIRGTLIPVRGGSHRLYINGGMRKAAGVDVGDKVLLALTPSRSEEVKPPADLTRALKKHAAASRAFNKLAAKTRRELIRYVDDARSTKNRTARIGKVVEHVRGKASQKNQTKSQRPLWTCPKCGNQFVTRNMYHSCARYEIDDCFQGKTPIVRELFDRLRSLIESFGPVRLIPYRNRIGFMVRVRFAGATPRRNWLDVGFWLRRRFQNPRFRRVETLYPDAHIYSVRITNPADLDAELKGWILEAYKVGCQDIRKI